MNILNELFVSFLFIGKNLKIFSIIILLPSILIAQSGSLSGNISDSETGEKLIFVNVRLENSTIGTASNENGDYLIENIVPGTYVVVVTAVGYETQKTEIVIIDDFNSLSCIFIFYGLWSVAQTRKNN